MQSEKLKVNDVVTAQIVGPAPTVDDNEGKDNDNKERKEPATEATDSDTDTRNSKDGVVGGKVRADNPS